VVAAPERMIGAGQRVSLAMWLVGHRGMRRAVERCVDGEAPLRERARVLAHLGECRSCRAAALFLVDLRAALRRRRRNAPVMIAGARLRRWARRLVELEPWATST
jgi:predicted anti-sigma-YlaC factor YlaD